MLDLSHEVHIASPIGLGDIYQLADRDILQPGEDPASNSRIKVADQHRRSVFPRCRPSGPPTHDVSSSRNLQRTVGIKPDRNDDALHPDRRNREVGWPRADAVTKISWRTERTQRQELLYGCRALRQRCFSVSYPIDTDTVVKTEGRSNTEARLLEHLGWRQAILVGQANARRCVLNKPVDATKSTRVFWVSCGFEWKSVRVENLAVARPEHARLPPITVGPSCTEQQDSREQVHPPTP